MGNMYQSNQRFEIAKNIIITELDGESVLLDSTKGQYFGLNQVGSFIIKEIRKGQSFDAIHSLMAQHYAIDESTAKQDLIELLNQLLEQNILFK